MSSTKSKPLQMSDADARKFYSTADPFGKAVLENSFGADFFKMSIIDRVKSVEDLFAIAGKTYEEVTAGSETKDEIAYRLLKFGIEIFNEGVKPDYSKGNNQAKYEPFFYDNGSGLGLSFGDYAYWNAGTYVGPRLCYLKADVLKHAVVIMKDWYHDFYN